MCSGRIDLAFILRAFAKGQDGVFIGGCRLGECNYTTHGNYDALATTMIGKKILERIGINPKRLRIDFMSAADGNLLAGGIDEFTMEIKALGPLGKSENLDPEALRLKLDAAMKLVPYIKLVERESLKIPEKNRKAYEDFFQSATFDRLFDELIGTHLTMNQIKLFLGRPPRPPALAFKEMISFYIDPDKCRACMICMRKCPVQAVIGAKKTAHVIDQEKCIRCGTCLEVCPPRFGAVKKVFNEPVPVDLPRDRRTTIKNRQKNE